MRAYLCAGNGQESGGALARLRVRARAAAVVVKHSLLRSAAGAEKSAHGLIMLAALIVAARALWRRKYAPTDDGTAKAGALPHRAYLILGALFAAYNMCYFAGRAAPCAG